MSGDSGNGDDDEGGDGGGDDDDDDDIAFNSVKEKLMVLLMDYRKTCTSRKSLLTTMDTGLARLLKEAEKDLAAVDAEPAAPALVVDGRARLERLAQPPVDCRPPPAQGPGRDGRADVGARSRGRRRSGCSLC